MKHKKKKKAKDIDAEVAKKLVATGSVVNSVVLEDSLGGSSYVNRETTDEDIKEILDEIDDSIGIQSNKGQSNGHWMEHKKNIEEVLKDIPPDMEDDDDKHPLDKEDSDLWLWAGFFAFLVVIAGAVIFAIKFW